MSEERTMALYQTWPRHITANSGIMDVASPTLCIKVFPATMLGLRRATGKASRVDAKLIRLPGHFFHQKDLKEFVVAQVKKGIYVPVYKAAMVFPEESKGED